MAIPYNPWTTGGASGGQTWTAPVPTEGGGTLKPKTTKKIIGPGGETTTSEEYGLSAAEELEQQLAARDKYNKLAEARRLAMFQGLDAGGGDGGTDSNLSFNEEAARNAAFARAKGRAGQTARASLDALREIQSSRGLLGGAKEAQGAESVIGEAAGGLGEFENEQLMLDLNRAGEIGNRNYAGALTRRGQDIEKRRSLLALLSSSGGAIY